LITDRSQILATLKSVLLISKKPALHTIDTSSSSDILPSLIHYLSETTDAELAQAKYSFRAAQIMQKIRDKAANAITKEDVESVRVIGQDYAMVAEQVKAQAIRIVA
jgi:hypothetical protein